MVRRSSLVLCVLLLTPLAARAQTIAPPPEPQITTMGEAVIKRAPDQAFVSLTVEARESKAADARKEAALAMTSLQGALKAVGLTPDALKTVSFSLQPEVEWQVDHSRIKDYLVRNQIDVRIDDLDMLGETLDAAGSQKTTATLSVSIASLRYELKDRMTSEQEVLALAVKDALRRVDALANGAGRPRGPILRIDDQRIDSPRQGPIPMARASGAASAGRAGGVPEIGTPITPAEIEIRAQVTVSVAIK